MLTLKHQLHVLNNWHWVQPAVPLPQCVQHKSQYLQPHAQGSLFNPPENDHCKVELFDQTIHRNLHAALCVSVDVTHLIAYEQAGTVSHNRFITTNVSELAFFIILMYIPIYWQFFHIRLLQHSSVFQSLQADSITSLGNYLKFCFMQFLAQHALSVSMNPVPCISGIHSIR